MQLIEEALRAMILNDPALLERSVQIGRYLKYGSSRDRCYCKACRAMAASRQMDGFVQLLAELQSLPNFPPRLSLAAPLGQISASSFVYQPTSSGKRGKWKAGAARDPIQHANIVAALCSRREERRREQEDAVISISKEFPGARDVDFQAAYREVYQRKGRGRPRKNI